MAKTSSLVAAILALTVPAVASAGKPTTYSPTLTVAWPLTTSSTSEGTPYVVNGCGYDPAFGGVTVVFYTPVSAAWTGQLPDANGCISLSNASTQGPGTYRIEAWQHVGKKDVLVASTTFGL